MQLLMPVQLPAFFSIRQQHDMGRELVLKQQISAVSLLPRRTGSSEGQLGSERIWLCAKSMMS